MKQRYFFYKLFNKLKIVFSAQNTQSKNRAAAALFVVATKARFIFVRHIAESNSFKELPGRCASFFM